VEDDGVLTEIKRVPTRICSSHPAYHQWSPSGTTSHCLFWHPDNTPFERCILVIYSVRCVWMKMWLTQSYSMNI